MLTAASVILSIPRRDALPTTTSIISMRSWLHRIVTHAKESALQLIRIPEIAPIVIDNIAVQFSTQPLLHYWQFFLVN